MWLVYCGNCVGVYGCCSWDLDWKWMWYGDGWFLVSGGLWLLYWYGYWCLVLDDFVWVDRYWLVLLVGIVVGCLLGSLGFWCMVIVLVGYLFGCVWCVVWFFVVFGCCGSWILVGVGGVYGLCCWCCVLVWRRICCIGWVVLYWWCWCVGCLGCGLLCVGCSVGV